MCIGVKCINSQKESFVVFCVYNSPSADKWEFTELLSKLMSQYSEVNIPCLIVGDMNIDLIKSNRITNKYSDEIRKHGFSQYVTGATRVTPESNTLIDHVLHNNIWPNIEVTVVQTDITDHFGVKVKLPILTKKKHCLPTTLECLTY